MNEGLKFPNMNKSDSERAARKKTPRSKEMYTEKANAREASAHEACMLKLLNDFPAFVKNYSTSTEIKVAVTTKEGTLITNDLDKARELAENYKSKK